jgi:hypothetical protein
MLSCIVMYAEGITMATATNERDQLHSPKTFADLLEVSEPTLQRSKQ